MLKSNSSGSPSTPKAKLRFQDQVESPVHKSATTQFDVPSDEPVTLKCFHCHQHVTTRTENGPSTLTWGICAVMCIFVCWPFCLVPFCCSSLNVTEHFCTNCDALVGKHKAWKKNYEKYQD